MTRYIEGLDRRQTFLLPEDVDDYVDEDNPVRVVEAFVERLDLAELGFRRATPAETGRPAFHPGTLLKFYIYGYLNRIPSSRRLEREARRNVELMWLLGRLVPDFKTIADFRRDNGPAIRATCRQFVLLCRTMGLLSDALAAIDGSKFKAVNSRDKNFTPAKLRARLKQVEESIARYMAAMESADRQEGSAASGKSVRLAEKIEVLHKQMQWLQSLEEAIKQAPDHQISLTDPDARSMATSGKGTGVVGYNVQFAVDAEHHLIVAHDVTNVGNDRAQLVSMSRQARAAVGRDQLMVIADRGYFSGKQILTAESEGIVPYVPRTLTSSAMVAGRFGKQDFVYLPRKDVYRCPAGKDLPFRSNTVEHDMLIRVYWRDDCGSCAIKHQCTTGKERRVRRWEHEEVLEAMQKRLDQVPQAMSLRRQTAEHPFGTLKAWMGATHFLTRTLKRVSTEMSFQVLAYNIKRVLAIMGTGALLQAIQA
ncbi:MAG TPA: IS1182 family transposase [Acidisoma sp.]|uniref:IS1182 family transposase n=1 Tax=Acidisoma sp. TaxID=1872115 RepID=UPI002B8142A4|nr:IS1182 family transposase [Acidisoma sp.]HTH99814.1 IS1182 family transposase [Acidisoma sp.]